MRVLLALLGAASQRGPGATWWTTKLNVVDAIGRFLCGLEVHTKSDAAKLNDHPPPPPSPRRGRSRARACTATTRWRSSTSRADPIECASTFKTRAQTKKGKNRYLGLFVVLLFGSFVIPMAQQYVRDIDQIVLLRTTTGTAAAAARAWARATTSSRTTKTSHASPAFAVCQLVGGGSRAAPSRRPRTPTPTRSCCALRASRLRRGASGRAGNTMHSPPRRRTRCSSKLTPHMSKAARIAMQGQCPRTRYFAVAQISRLYDAPASSTKGVAKPTAQSAATRLARIQLARRRPRGLRRAARARRRSENQTGLARATRWHPEEVARPGFLQNQNPEELRGQVRVQDPPW